MRTAYQSSLGTDMPPPPVSAWLSQPSGKASWIDRKPRTIDPLANLIMVAHKAKGMLELPDNWDDAGSPAIRRDTFLRALLLLLLHAALILMRHSVVIPTPRISPGPDGSIDLHWKTRRRELLISIPQDLREPAAYYGDNFGSDKKKGAIQPNVLDLELFAWLAIVE
jgi:hypothetical protein